MWPLLRGISTGFLGHLSRRPVVLNSRNVSVQPGRRAREKRRNFLAYGGAALAGIFSVWWVKRGIRNTSSEEKGQVIIDKDFGKFVKFKGYMLPDQVYKLMPRLDELAIRSDDVFVVSFPKSGTTWVQEIVYLLMNNADFTSASQRTIEDRFPFLEYPCPGLEVVNNMESPRLIKTHLPFSLLPKQITDKKPKIVYIARNPRDVTVSYFHFCKTITFLSFQGDFNHFFNKFLKSEVPYAPWFKHVKEFAECEEMENVLFITYEELHKDITGSIKRIATFLQKDVSEENLLRIAAFCSFKNMKDNKTSNYSWLEETGLKGKGEAFMRKGKIGDWKNYYSSEMCNRMDQVLDEKLMGREFVYKPFDET